VPQILHLNIRGTNQTQTTLNSEKIESLKGLYESKILAEEDIISQSQKRIAD
jgi:hypothetical protein